MSVGLTFAIFWCTMVGGRLTNACIQSRNLVGVSALIASRRFLRLVWWTLVSITKESSHMRCLRNVVWGTYCEDVCERTRMTDYAQCWYSSIQQKQDSAAHVLNEGITIIWLTPYHPQANPIGEWVRKVYIAGWVECNTDTHRWLLCHCWFTEWVQGLAYAGMRGLSLGPQLFITFSVAG